MKRPLAGFFILSLFFVSYAGAFTPPSWFKNGTYVTYAVLPGEGRYKDYFNSVSFIPSELSTENRKSFESSFENGKRECQEFREGIENSKNYSILRSFLVFGPIFITFNLTDVTNSSAVVLVTLTLENATPSPGCWVDSLTFRGKLFLNLTDGYYYINGSKLGRPTFFILPYNLPERKSLLYKASILKRYGFTVVGDLKVNNVTFAQDKLVHTFVRTFRPPLVRIRSNWLPIIYQKKGYLSSFIGFESLYDLNTGIAIDIDSPYPELYAAGIMFVAPFNYYSAEINDKIDFSREYWPYEFVLYKTNIRFPEDRTGTRPDTALKYYMLFGVGALVVSLIRRWKR
ncbi:hypothetical protein TK0165 [Thermococcus kodakarensis KOD1]|uniref:Uncharacterized protein n=1 Tax=Thermococcus kodakarensis (strain ATCC BAA-918 / JCM 12380 / KOD1) TaxID=69014 RepID=Q5JFK0_THEKO|nr:hypothetical protein [Thermococcus kodakarensis]WCN28265.1 hypothetical protein POG15_00850 [Thermococcus kodakarensis]WCN30560.1 hypothetical protein POG21_00850 [Thermococcus kodakarensis]BAD84354.1 hypothetical protein TK0165 [Thermococcus kodakarensis KOD1]